MPGIIISPKTDNISEGLQFLNKAADELALTCKRNKCKNLPTYLKGYDATKDDLKEGIKKELKKQKLFVFYGPLSRGNFSGSDGEWIIDILQNNFGETEIADPRIKEYIKGSNIYVITLGDDTISVIGEALKNYYNVKSYIGFNDKNNMFGTSLFDIVKRDREIEKMIIDIINNVPIEICCNSSNARKAMFDTWKLCVSSTDIIINKINASGIPEEQKIKEIKYMFNNFNNFTEKLCSL